MLGGGSPPVDGAICTLLTCASQNATCGPVGDGCVGVIDCGACTAPDFCGGDGELFTCGGGSGSGACVPTTCAAAGAQCGSIADGCGGITADCGTCPTGQVCGVGVTANICTTPPCTGLCLEQAACGEMPATTVTGTVTAPGHTDTATWGVPDPIYGALVYVPNGAAGPPTYGVTAFTPGVACESCSSSVSGSPIVTTVTGIDGKFTLTNVPCGNNIPLVMQVGRWRREITIPHVTCCANTALTNTQTHLPRNKVGEPGDLRSDIPLMAFSTGDVDTLHCVLRKIGIDDAEFTNPTGTGRVRFYQDTGAVIDASTPAASALYGNAAELAKYDVALFECVGDQVQKAAADQQRVINFANAGGRVFATHYSYVWLTDSDGSVGTNTGPKPFSQTASWLVNQNSFDTTIGLVDQTLQGDAATQARRVAFASWLQLVGASTTPGQIPVNAVREDFNSVSTAPATASGTPAQRWLYTADAFNGPLHYTFDTPIAYSPNAAPTTQCGRVLYSDFHVSDDLADSSVFPSECSAGPMTPQEKTLEFMLFDLASCLGPQPSTCTPRTCEDQGIHCGPAGDGCDDGVVLHCGVCPMGKVCGQGGPSTCGTGLCTPRTCADVGAECGTVGDGCGAILDCGFCSEGLSCGSTGIPNQCGGLL